MTCALFLPIGPAFQPFLAVDYRAFTATARMVEHVVRTLRTQTPRRRAAVFPGSRGPGGACAAVSFFVQVHNELPCKFIRAALCVSISEWK